MIKKGDIFHTLDAEFKALTDETRHIKAQSTCIFTLQKNNRPTNFKLGYAYSFQLSDVTLGPHPRRDNNPQNTSTINHPPHYGGHDNPYEAIKVIEAWELGFCLGNALKYISRAGKKTESRIEDLEKAIWYLKRELQNESEKNI